GGRRRIRGFAPIGVLEKWSDGVMVLLEYCKMVFSLLLSITPVLQHSSTPCGWNELTVTESFPMLIGWVVSETPDLRRCAPCQSI
ncbi:MAG: hypothetical protein KAT27_06385, partial [Desulfobacterales bacterium]|nr:hypothetical protein [Desulfobacterales bacterium]